MKPVKLGSALLLLISSTVLFVLLGAGLTQEPPPPRLPRDLQTRPPAKTQGGAKVEPKLIPIAETRLLMEGLTHPNFRGLERTLKQKPADDKAWVFARGQALLIAETANLLMLRPPRNQGEALWFARAMDLRTAAKQLAETISKRDFEASRSGLIDLAARCNRCHKSFRVNVQISAFDEKAGMP
jgi:hypothetical protein